MDKIILQAIFEKIKASRRVMLFRHTMPDGDCVGATKGFKEILKATWPEKEVYLIDGEKSDYLAFLGPDDREVPDEIYRDALGIVLDTATRERISNPKYALCRELIKIDHHIEVDRYGDLNWVEEERPAVCEMIAAFYAEFRNELKLTCGAAADLYAGMVTDTGRFQYRGVTGETLRLAGMLLDAGVDTETLYANLYLKELDSLKFKAYVYGNMEITPAGVAHVYIGQETQKRFGLTYEEACTAISFMDSIRGCICWIAMIETGNEKNAVRVRLRSRFMSVNALAEKYEGGGHACASGATVYSAEEARSLIRDADRLTAEYKAMHDDWL